MTVALFFSSFNPKLTGSFDKKKKLGYYYFLAVVHNFVRHIRCC